jgi:hypothetical protein
MGSPAGAGFSIAGAGLGAYGDVLKGEGIQAGDEFKAATLENAAARGRVAATEVGADYTRKIATDLGNIDALRAANHTDPTSPTGAAIRDYHEQIGTTQKTIAVDNIIAQSQQEDAEAKYLREAGKTALLSGYIGAGADLLKGIGQGLSGLGGGGAQPSMPAGYNPNSLSGLYCCVPTNGPRASM